MNLNVSFIIQLSQLIVSSVVPIVYDQTFYLKIYKFTTGIRFRQLLNGNDIELILIFFILLDILVKLMENNYGEENESLVAL